MTPGRLRVAAIITLIHAAFTGISLLHHEIWLDEMQAWLLANNTSLGELSRLLHYEGHPGLWHLLLKITGWIFPRPEAMQALHWVIAVTAVFLFNFHAPFSMPERIFFTFGYYQVYEYCIISRNYGLGWLCLIAALIFYHRKKYLCFALALSALAHSHFLGWIIAAAFILTPIAESLIDRLQKRKGTETTLPTFAAFLIAAAGLCTSLYTFYPAADIGLYDIFGDARRQLLPSLIAIVGAFVPALDPYSWFAHLNPFHLISSAGVLAVLIILLGFWLFRMLEGNRRSLLFFLGAAFGLIFFFFFFYAGQARHHGYLFLAFVAALWMKRSSATAGGGQTTSLTGAAFLALLALQSIYGFAAHAYDLNRPFTQAPAVAQFLKRAEFQGALLVADPDYNATSIAGYLGRGIYSPKSSQQQSYVTWNQQSAVKLAPEAVLASARRIVGDSRGVLIVAGRARADAIARQGVPLVAAFEGSIVRSEDFYIFELSGRASQNQLR